jgi:cell division protein FtsI (penicillin-binding protein 3)
MSKPRTRIRIISIGIIVFALLLVTKLYFVQIVSGSDFKQLANRQYLQPASGVYDRGTIFFQAKDGTLMAAASLQTGYTLAVNPQIITNPEADFAALSKIVPTIDHDTFIKQATKPNDTYEEIADRIDPDQATAVTALKLTGVSLYQEKWRYYPGETLAAQVLGFVGYDGSKMDGRYGLENYYDSTLERTGDDVYVNLFAQIFSDVHDTFANNGTAEGDIVSTIEPNVEAYLETQLQDVQTKYSSKITGGIIIDPTNGKIYAMGATPTFNPNSYQDVSDISVYNNPLVQNVYELGSIMKSITMSIGLDTGVITPATTYEDSASINVDGFTIHNWDLQGHGLINMQKVLSDSLNVGAAWVENRIGNKDFRTYMYNFGFGEKTGIDLPNEANNLISNLNNNRAVEFATASFGQGIAVTPISMVRALSALANGGTLITPHVVDQIQYDVGYTKEIDPPPGPRVISTTTSATITKMLVNVYDGALNDDNNNAIMMPHYSIAAKTGTAQLVDTSTGGYYDNRYLHSFFGYFPASNPKFLVFLYTYDPQGEELAAHTLAMPFFDIAKFLINYYDISPDR